MAVFPTTPTPTYSSPYALSAAQRYGMIVPTQESTNQRDAQATSNEISQSYIPDYSETPILNEAAQYARSMAPQIYQWGMDQFNKNQGNIDTMMRNALTYASPQRVAQLMGQTEAGVMQGAEQQRQAAIQGLQSYGIDPSSGRYAALDQANRVMAGAQAAGAANQARMGAEQTGTQMQQAAEGLSLQNVGTGYGAAAAANQYLQNAMSLKFPPLGQTSQKTSQSTDVSSGQSQSQQYYPPSSSGSGGGGGGGYGGMGNLGIYQSEMGRYFPRPAGGTAMAQEGGYIDSKLSPTRGAQTDDVPAQLNAGEFVIPKDVSAWKGQEFFYKLMAQSRAARAKMGTPPEKMGVTPSEKTGYQRGGGVDPMTGQANLAAYDVDPTGAYGGGYMQPPSPGPMADIQPRALHGRGFVPYRPTSPFSAPMIR